MSNHNNILVHNNSSRAWSHIATMTSSMTGRRFSNTFNRHLQNKTKNRMVSIKWPIEKSYNKWWIGIKLSFKPIRSIFKVGRILYWIGKIIFMCRKKGRNIIKKWMKNNSKSQLYFICRRSNNSKKWRIFPQVILILLRPVKSTLSIIIVKVIVHLFAKKINNNSHQEEKNKFKISKILLKRHPKSSVKNQLIQIKVTIWM